MTRLSGLFCWEAYVRVGHELEDTPELFSASLYWDTRNVTHLDRTFARGHINGGAQTTEPRKPKKKKKKRNLGLKKNQKKTPGKMFEACLT